MFSKLLSSARQIFTKPENESIEANSTLHSTLDSKGRKATPSRSPKKSSSPRKRVPIQSAYSVQKEKRDRLTMVTTRRQSGALLLGSQSNSAATSENEINEDEIAYELLTLSAQKRRREKAREAGEETPTKRRKVPIREKGISPAVTVHSRLAVEIPVKDVDEDGEVTPQAISDVAAKLAAAETSALSTPTQTRKRGRPSKKSLLDAEEQLEKDMAAFEAEKAAKQPSSHDAPAAETTPKVTKKAKLSPPAQVEKVTTPPVEEEKKETPAKPKHKKFGDDEPVVAINLPEPIAPIAPIDEQGSGSESEEEDSDDDAPEEVGGKAAEKQAQEKAAQAVRVAEQKEAANRQKRRERDEKLRIQADASKKRKAVEEQKAKMMPIDELDSESEEDESVTLQEEFSPVLETAHTVAREKKIKFDRNNLPDLLPEEFLNDEDRMDVDEDERPVKKAKKITFAREEKKVKDVTLGHTTFRVQKKTKMGLAPKANKRAKMLKEALLGGRKGQIRKAPTGFFGAKK